MPGTASHIGDRARAGEFEETCQQGTVQRLAVEFVTELVSVGARHRVVGRPNSNRHLVLTRVAGAVGCIVAAHVAHRTLESVGSAA